MDLNALNSAACLVIGVMVLVAVANLLDFGLRNMADKKAFRAERARFLKWGLPARAQPQDSSTNEHLWHF